jgi:hypothetical protein
MIFKYTHPGWVAGVSGAIGATSCIPDMTGYTTPSGEVQDNSNTTNPGWQAFDRDNATFTEDSWNHNETSLRYEFPSAKTAVGWSVVVGSVPCDGFCTLMGSNDGVQWSATELDSQFGRTWVDGTKQTFYFFNSTAYLYYHFYFTSTGSWGVFNPKIKEIELFCKE